MKKIYIAGCGGMLGEAFYKQFKNDYLLKCTDIDVNESWLSKLDFRNFDEYRKDVEEFEPDFLFHLGAYTDLEYCELNPEDAYETNTRSVRYAVQIANQLNIPLLYISTAGIFDGKKELYDDWDTPNPLGVYAKTKYEGELFVCRQANRYLVCRAGWMMGGGPKKDKKFIQKLLKQIKDGKTELYVVEDKDGTPTYTHDFAANVKALLEKAITEPDWWGVYNMVCEGQTSRLEVSKELIEILNLKDKVSVIPVVSSYFRKTYFADRPASERLINKKLSQKGLNLMRDWHTALREYINNYYSDYLKNI
ncbi:MAG: NAD(P)-dependent oxidoreductase [Dysgonamonadaceae bacterium]|jgi:dTDP-4-dehydrorhamnose reductase|nr:NAD(P)-dependent oxidoreductase [Dysgonamonadaceae bacterium]